MEDLPALVERAKALRARIAEFLDKFGDLSPELRQLHDEAARIEEHLKELDELRPDLE